jgi:hypothetical protein
MRYGENADKAIDAEAKNERSRKGLPEGDLQNVL